MNLCGNYIFHIFANKIQFLLHKIKVRMLKRGLKMRLFKYTLFRYYSHLLHSLWMQRGTHD